LKPIGFKPFLLLNLFLVLVDLFEVLVCIYLKLTAGILVASNDAAGVKLKCADCPSVVNAALNAVLKCTSFVVSADKQENLLGIANCSNTNRKSGLGNLVGIVIKES
jgi:hypothetical protein